METAVYILQILIWVLCPVIIGLILLQGAAGDLSSSFGGGGVLDSTLGVGAHRKMSKATGVLAGIFFVVILFLAYQHHHGFGDVKPGAAPAKKAVEAPKPDAAKPQAPAAPATKPETLTAPSAPKAEVPAKAEAAAPPVEAAKPEPAQVPVAPAVAAPAAPVPAAPVEAKPEPAAKP